MLEGELVGSAWLSVEVVECRHEGQASASAKFFEGRKVDVSEGVLGNEGGIVVSAALGGTVSHVMLPAGCHRSDVFQVFALESLHCSRAHHRGQIWVLSESLSNSAPSGISGDVDHGREGPLDAHG